MPYNVQEADFQEKVIQKSFTIPVLVDFWAEWCGPCRMLSPILDKIESDLADTLVVAKVNTDENQGISMQYKISGIPAVKLFINGEVKAEFTGALPENQIRQFLAKNILSGDEKEIIELAQKDPIRAADKILAAKMQSEAFEKILWQAALFSLANHKPVHTIFSYLEKIPEIGSPYSDSRNALYQFLQKEPDPQELEAFLLLFEEEKAEKGLDFFLQKVENASSDKRMQIKDELLTCFFILGNNHPLVNQYRRKLSQVLY